MTAHIKRKKKEQKTNTTGGRRKIKKRNVKRGGKKIGQKLVGFREATKQIKNSILKQNPKDFNGTLKIAIKKQTN